MGAELIKRVDYVCFTGSVATGKKVYRAAAERFVPASLELGGKDPLIVLEGAKVHMGGEIVDHGGKWCLPTVLTDVDHSMHVMLEESFGPLLPIMPFRTVEEAIRLANDSDYGLSATVYAGKPEEGEEVARAIEAGGVSVNRAGISLLVRGIEQDARNASGMGKNRMGREGIRRFTRSKAIMTYGGEDEIAPSLAEQVFTGR